MGLNKKESSNIEGASLKAFGLISGVGSLLYGAKKAGFEILGNCDWRKYYHTGSFEYNFDRPFTMELSDYDIPKLKGITIVMGHPECGNFSTLRAKKTDLTNPLDIPKFIKEVGMLQPQFVLMDNLPKSLLVYDIPEYQKHLKDYDLFFEWVSNWGYGNVQKYRNRMFLIASHKDLAYKFIPGEKSHNKVTKDAIKDCEGLPNHHPVTLEDKSNWPINYFRGWDKNKKNYSISWGEWNKLTKEVPIKQNLSYYNMKNELKVKPGYFKIDINKFCPVLSGGGGFPDNHFFFDPEREYWSPFSIRERLRIMGFDDDFILLPKRPANQSRDYNYHIKQTGKCMPVQFAYYFADQVKRFLKGGELPQNGTRVIKPNPHISKALMAHKQIRLFGGEK